MSSYVPIPILASYYLSAHREVFGSAYVTKKEYALFLVFEDELRGLEVPCGKYAHTVVRILKKWTISRGMKRIPVNVFCGDWALKRFLVIAERKYVDISNDDEAVAIYHSEMMVAKKYIDRNAAGDVCRIGDVVEELKPLLTEEWLEAYKIGGDRRTNEVIDDLCDEYGVQNAWTYNDFIAIRSSV